MFIAHSPYTDKYFCHNLYCTMGCIDHQLNFVLYTKSEYCLHIEKDLLGKGSHTIFNFIHHATGNNFILYTLEINKL